MVDLGVSKQSIGRLVRVFFVVERVEDSHQIPVDIDGPRDPDVLAKGACDTLRDAGFPVSRVAVEEHAPSGVDRGSEAGQELWRDKQIRKGFAKVLVSRVLVFDRLQANRLDVVGERNGRRAEIGCFEHVASCSVPTCVGKRVDVIVDCG